MGSVWYIYMCDGSYIYVYKWNACVDGMQKKIKFLLLCRGQWPRPSAKKGPLPRAQAIALGKDFFEKKILTISLPRAREQALGKGLKKIQKNHFFAEGWPSAKNF